MRIGTLLKRIGVIAGVGVGLWLGAMALGFGQPATRGPVTPVGDVPAAVGWRSTPLIVNLDRPWGMAFLPDGGLLITEKRGTLRLATPEGSGFALRREPLITIPGIFSDGQGGLMDVALHPRFAENNWVFLTYSAGTREANRTVLARGVLREGAFTDLTTLWEVSQPKPGGQHFGSRILFLPDGSMLVAIGDGGNPPVRLDGGLIRDNAQNLKSHYGKVVRLTDEGRPAEGNPFAGRPDADPAVWTLGHRNIQGMAIDPASGRVWATEHGARGGDELNLLVAGTNYGWPKATYSIEYWGPRISEHEALEGMADPVAVWTPCIAPSGLVFYTGDKFPAWRGNLLAGGLVSNDVRRVVLDDPAGASPRMVNQDRLRFDGRVRDVRQGPDGLIYVLTDERPGKLIRVEPGP